ncbi:hypothetical protein EXN67_08275 [Rhizobium rhizogenes]|nr:hypothetical protein Arad_4991 [Rhizobium rhizogenes K84]MQB32392.1 hypothetical protein [Rhizobium rhizogenes]QRM38500.1 hypothetical protein F3X89_12065 [Rhizobium rhizogenes]TQO75231.1 hypothetical protein FFE80_25810 [Rhizobium rhizogenes]TRB12663.1 hypothetical protein EXN67_08275 [Rhizobium rhizogenes]
MYIFLLTSPGRRPPYYTLAEHLWGAACNVDSDGDSSDPDAADWTQLTLRLRLCETERIDIDPISSAGTLVLSIRSEREDLAHRAAVFLCEKAGGILTRA